MEAIDFAQLQNLKPDELVKIIQQMNAENSNLKGILRKKEEEEKSVQEQHPAVALVGGDVKIERKRTILCLKKHNWEKEYSLKVKKKNLRELLMQASLTDKVGVISVVGDNQSGKSTIIKALCNMSGSVGPCVHVKSDDPVTGDVQLYRITLDGKPFIILDFEGEGAQKIPKNLIAVMKEFLWAPDEAEKRAAAVSHYFPAMASALADVIIYVSRQPFSNVQYLNKLTTFSVLSVGQNSTTARPSLILVHNGCKVSDIEESQTELTKKWIKDTKDHSSFKVSENFEEIKLLHMPLYTDGVEIVPGKAAVFKPGIGAEKFNTQLHQLKMNILEMSKRRFANLHKVGLGLVEYSRMELIPVIASEITKTGKIDLAAIIKRLLLPKEAIVKKSYAFFEMLYNAIPKEELWHKAKFPVSDHTTEHPHPLKKHFDTCVRAAISCMALQAALPFKETFKGSYSPEGEIKAELKPKWDQLLDGDRTGLLNLLLAFAPCISEYTGTAKRGNSRAYCSLVACLHQTQHVTNVEVMGPDEKDHFVKYAYHWVKEQLNLGWCPTWPGCHTESNQQDQAYLTELKDYFHDEYNQFLQTHLPQIRSDGNLSNDDQRVIYLFRKKFLTENFKLIGLNLQDKDSSRIERTRTTLRNLKNPFILDQKDQQTVTYCFLCLEELTGTKSASPKACFHKFCEQCVTQVNQNMGCPICSAM